MSITVILPENSCSAALRAQLESALEGIPHTFAGDAEHLTSRRLLFAVALDECGGNEGAYRVLCRLRRSPRLLEGCTAALVVTGQGEFYTKATARTLALSANLAGCAFIGRPLVEATGSLQNFRTQAQLSGTDEAAACAAALRDLAQRLERHTALPPIRRVAALHASSRATSNTLALWDLVRRNLPEDVEIREFGLRNGTVVDCIGCSYSACLHYGEHSGCFYGGVMTEAVFPAILACDTLVMLCANYNDALSANLTACVNRLTALYRRTRFYDKRVYGLVVSGYSGGDLVAQQLISSLNMNKSFYLPPRFCLLETANDAGSLVKLPGVEQRAADFARQMMHA